MTTAAPERLTTHPEEAAVRLPLELYMRGHAEDCAAHMRAAFLPSARLESVREGPLTSWTLDVYCQRFQNTPAADEALRRLFAEAEQAVGVGHGSARGADAAPTRQA